MNKSSKLPCREPELTECCSGTPERLPLLVSVRNLQEAAIASRFPVSIIDFKDPESGALGRCGPDVFRNLDPLAQAGNCLSVACGELLDVADISLPEAVAFAKAGPAGLSCPTQLRRRMRGFKEHCMQSDVTPVAVAYADYQMAETLHPREVACTAAELGFRWFLVDTVTKDGRSLFDWMDRRQLADLITEIHQRDMRIVLAGSLSMSHLETLGNLDFDLIGLRGAVCAQGRRSDLCEARLRAMCERLRESNMLAHRRGDFLGKLSKI